ncbi:hypothetical protein PROPHIGD91-2_53 [Mycobacterium phage prophiGD91-2]|nr:hypothetical protein PROPHIGD91-2_53 [Mycobacterium phage prophiGD91-2]
MSDFERCGNCRHFSAMHAAGGGTCLSPTEGQAGMHEGLCGCDQFEETV